MKEDYILCFLCVSHETFYKSDSKDAHLGRSKSDSKDAHLGRSKSDSKDAHLEQKSILIVKQVSSFLKGTMSPHPKKIAFDL